MRTFGATAYSHIPEEKRQKLDNRSIRGVMVGYPDSTCSTQLPTRTYQTCQTLLLQLPEVSTAPARTFHELTFMNNDNNMLIKALCLLC